MRSFKASAIAPRMAGALTRTFYAVGFSLAASAISAQAMADCQYVIDNQWNNGFTAKIKITNSGTSAISSWNLSWQYSGDNRITSSFNTTLTGTNPYSAANLSWNGSIAPNQFVEFGFQGTKGAATAEVPVITGAACGTSVQASSAAPASSRAASSTAVPASSKPTSIASTAPIASSARAASSVNNGAGVLFSDNFESGSVNTQPAGWGNFIGWVQNNGNTVSGAQYALLDSSKSYNGSQSIHFKGGAAPAQIIRALPAGTQRLYTRAYVYMSKPLGAEPSDNHEHIFGLKKTPDANDEVRVGQIKGVLGTNHVPSDNIAPKMDQWGKGVQMTANTWHCVEVAYLADQAYDTLYMWLNGNLVHTIDSSDDWNNGALAADWMSDKFNYVMFGFHSFSNNSADVWMDDIVVSTQPIGCGAVSPTSSSARSSVAPSSVPRSSVAPSSVPRSSVAPSSVARSSAVSSVLNGQQIFTTQCASCHQLTTSFPAERSQTVLSAYIQANMPRNNPGSCTADCANAVSNYLLGRFTSSSTPSSVARSSVAPSSVARSSVVPSSVARSSVIATSSSRASSSVANTAAWTLDTTLSYLNFVTTKNTSTVEVQSFDSISGNISMAGIATLTIDLSTVNTGVTLRDQRMRDLLFEVANFPTATVTITVPATLISSLAVGQSAATDITATLNLHGVMGTLTTKVSVQKLSSTRVLVQSLSPVMIKAGDYALTDGVEALRVAVAIASISSAVPVYFTLFFDAR